MKIISYPLSHYNCWVSSNYYSTKKPIFENKVISKLLPEVKKESIVNSGRISREKAKAQRLSTEEVRRSPPKSEPKKRMIS